MRLRSVLHLSGLLFAVPFAAPLAAATDDATATCYSATIPMPPVRRQTLVLIDETTPVAPPVAEAFKRGVLLATRAPGQRVVVLTFAGLAANERPMVRFDAIAESPITDPDEVDRLPIKPLRASQTCVQVRQAAWPQRVAAAVDGAMPRLSGPDFQRSEILYALGEVLKSFAAPEVSTRLLVFSDGLQHGSGVSFYRDSRPRAFDAAIELARLPKAAAAAPMSQPGAVDVLWWGLMAQKADAPSAAAGTYFDAAQLAQLATFWTHLLEGWHVRSVQIGPTLLNPRLESDAGAGAVWPRRPALTAGATPAAAKVE